ncbi:MAG: PQQ-binding-like beta-propeller repeat protein [Pirellulaceae bacterium]|jgi:outer membrane protein assembly factor BamB|nr:PQQ-binding-like beta-propeller repeat protein [Pirellulaceae bacterium]
MKLLSLVIVVILTAVADPRACVHADDRSRDVIDDSDLHTTKDLLRGFNDKELTDAKRANPPRREPPLGLPRPRLVTVTGRVYEDRNTNGERDADEPAMPDVMVTDGERVQRTGDDGAYHFRIRIDEDPHYRFVVVTRPTGFKPTSKVFLRIPFAEDQTEYSDDFGFVRDAAAAKREFWFMTASDSQFTSIEQMIPIAKDYAQVTGAPAIPGLGKPAFLITAGDLTMNGSQFEWDMYDRIRASSKIPVYEGFGGHDGNCLDPRCTVNFEQRIGPPYYSWDYGGVHFIQFVTETGYLRPTARLRHHDWLQADLKALPPKMPVIAISHYPLDSAWFDQRKARGINVIAQIGAHWHVVMAGSRGGAPVLNSAPARGRDWGAYSRTYRWVFVSPAGLRSKLRVAGQYKRLRTMAPGPTTRLGKQRLVVLAYDTALLVESVSCRWTSPSGEVSTARLEQQGDWSWYGDFEPNELGRWQCELSATDVGGETWKRTQAVDVKATTKPVANPGDDFSWVLAGTPPRRIRALPALRDGESSRNRTRLTLEDSSQRVQSLVTSTTNGTLSPLWVTHTGSVHVLHNSPVIAGGRVFVSVGNPNAGTPGAGVLCLDAATGKQIWKADSPIGDIRSAVSVHDNIVYAVTGEGWVAAYDAAKGRALWSKPMNAAYQDGRPLAINNTPPVPTRHGLLVSDWQKPQRLLDFTTGQELSQLPGDVGYYASFATVFDDVMVSVRRGGGSALRLPDGKEIYKFEEASRSTSAPIVVDGKLIYNGSSGIRVREASTGKLLWQKGLTNAGYQNAIPVVWDDQILVNGEDLRILDLETGETRRTVMCGREADRFLRSRRQAMAGSSTPIIAGDFAWFGHDDTSVRAINRDGDVVWEYRLGTPIKTAPAISGNLLFVHDYAGNLWCFAGSGERGK